MPIRSTANVPDYCQQSQNRALLRLIIKASGDKEKAGGGASLGDIPIDADRLFLNEVENTGTVFKVNGLLRYIQNLWEDGSPYQSEAHLNRFLIRLGKALATTNWRGQRPQLDWSAKRVDQTDRFLVFGWHESIVVDGVRWPPLCFLTHPAIKKFFGLCEHPLAVGDTADSFRKRIQRLGLKSIPRKDRIKNVEKKDGRFFFS